MHIKISYYSILSPICNKQDKNGRLQHTPKILFNRLLTIIEGSMRRAGMWVLGTQLFLVFCLNFVVRPSPVKLVKYNTLRLSNLL